MDDKTIGILLGVFAMLVMCKGLHELFTHGKSKELLIDTTKLSEEEALAAVIDPAIDEAIEVVVDKDSKTDDAKTEQQIERRNLLNVLLGLPSGFFSGILGISGGVVSVPLLRFFGAEDLRTAIANSSVIVFWASLVGAIVAFSHGISAGLIEWQAPVTLAVIMIPGAYFGGIVGSKLMQVLPTLFLKCFYTAIMAAVAVKMLILS